MITDKVQKVCLVVIDGWGLSSSNDPNTSGITGDVIKAASTPIMDSLAEQYGCLGLEAHGEAVGLPAGLMGNSEVGHLNIGAGRIVYQDILRINKMLDGDMNDNPTWARLLEQANSTNSRIHLIGLLSDGGVHSHIEHLLRLTDRLGKSTKNPISIHAITDGRDTAPQSCQKYLAQLMAHLKELPKASLATVMGRYYAMDRDRRWERTKIAYDAMTQGLGEYSSIELHDAVLYGVLSASNYLWSLGHQGEVLAFPAPTIANSLFGDGDICLFFNFRSDRMRQIVEAFSNPSVLPDIPISLQNHSIFTMTRYRHDFMFPVLSPPQEMKNVLAEWLSAQSVAQAHIAETEKFSHVTVFFNGGRELPFEMEERVLIPSPKVATYDLKPEMSSKEVATAVIDFISAGTCPLVMCNFAPPDMVGHTGKFPEAIKAVEATDLAIGRIHEACRAYGYILVITSDHGNAEKMIDPMTGAPHTAHTCALVPLIVAKAGIEWNVMDRHPALCDVAPTVLRLMNIALPPEMSGKSLLLNVDDKNI